MISFIIISVLFCGCSHPLPEKSSSDDSARKASLADISIEIIQARTTNAEQPFASRQVDFILDSSLNKMTARFKIEKGVPPQGSIFLIVTFRVTSPQDKQIELGNRDLVLVDDFTNNVYDGVFWIENAMTDKGSESLWGFRLGRTVITNTENKMLFTIPVESVRRLKIRFLDRQAVPIIIE